jgi:hypothetical protein
MVVTESSAATEKVNSAVVHRQGVSALAVVNVECLQRVAHMLL